MKACREVRGAVRRGGGTDGLDAAGWSHLASCPRCASEVRAAALLRIGSEVPGGAAPRPGFEARVLARLEAEAGAAAVLGPADLRPAGAASPASGWVEAVGALLRPSLALACALAIAAAGLYLAAGPATGADLTELLEQDPVLGRVLSGDPGAALTPDAPAAAEEGPR